LAKGGLAPQLAIEEEKKRKIRSLAMIDCYQYNLTENIQSCFVENWYQTWDFWIGFAIALIIVVIVFTWAEWSENR
jgi:hypothetical protein